MLGYQIVLNDNQFFLETSTVNATMDQNWAQDVLRCHLCETPVSSTSFLNCDICLKNMCKDCVGEHLSDESVEHRVMQFKNSKLTPYCQIHSTKPCELYCVQCDIPICTQCITSGEHVQHRIIDILESYNDKKKVIQKDIEEFEKSIILNIKIFLKDLCN